ncbi:MAG: PAS-domain containing protein [Alphaproteobacteria bacterium]|nr:PAS-domain containing protein [Alphaproteobacteria bacterium]
MNRLASHSIAALVVAAFTVACAFSSVRLAQQFDVFMDYFRTGNWIATQANVEYLRLAEELSAYQVEPAPAKKDGLLTRLDVFWSRLPLILEGEEGLKVRSLPGATEAVRGIVDDLPALERDLAALDGADPAPYRRARQRLEQYRAPLQEILQSLLMTDRSKMSSSTVREQQYETFAAFGLVVLSGACLIVMLRRSLRSARRAHDAARQAEAGALLARQQLEDAIESTNEGFVLYDRDERLVIANGPYKGFYPSIAAMVKPGVRLQDLLLESARKGEYATDQDPETWTRIRLQQHREPKGPFIQRLADGRVLRVSDRRTRGGGIVSVRADITDMVRAEELLRKRLTAIEASPDGIAMIDADGRMQYASKSFCAIYRESPEAMAGRPWAELFAGADRENSPGKAVGEARASATWRGSALAQRRDGTTFPMDLALSALEDGGLVLAMRDVQHELELQQQHARLERQFHQAQKMEAVGRLAGGIAHDFNNILAAIVGYAGFLSEDLAPGSDQAKFAAHIVTAANHAKHLVRQILAFSRSQDVERLPVAAGTVLEETAQMLRQTLPPSTRLEIDDRTRGAVVWANPTQIGQVLMNLCVNANDALEGNAGTVAISLEGPVRPPRAIDAARMPADHKATGAVVQEDPASGELRVVAGGPSGHERYICIAVADTGTGMSKRIIDRMFDPFFTTKEIGKGTGLGLAAVHGIVLAHDGLIEVTTREGKGTVFRIYLPVHAIDAATSNAGQKVAMPHGRERVLVIDDQELVATMLAKSLERLGYEVTACTDPSDAVEALGEDPNAWDAIVSDVKMPGISGLELVRFVKSLRPDIPVILCSGFSDELAEVQARALGVMAILAKPVDAAKLAWTLRRALDGERGADRDRPPSTASADAAIGNHAA